MGDNLCCEVLEKLNHLYYYIKNKNVFKIWIEFECYKVYKFKSTLEDLDVVSV